MFMGLVSFIKDLFSTSSGSLKVIIYRSVLDNIVDFAKNNYPKEFVSLLSGRIDFNTVIIDGLLYQPFSSNNNTAMFNNSFNLLPPNSGSMGSVHSHPSGCGRASSADRIMFNSRGGIHFIIAKPFNEYTLYCYDMYGNLLDFEIDNSK